MGADKFSPIIPISGEKLARRWRMDPIDIFFIMLNHDLDALGLRGASADAYAVINATSRSENKQLCPEKWSFPITDVLKLEEHEFVDTPPKRASLLRGTALLKKWEIDEGDLFLFAVNGDLSPVDPFGSPLKWDVIVQLLEEEMLKPTALLFLMSEIEQFENDYGHLLSARLRSDKNKERPFRIEPSESDLLTLCFYKNGDNWIVGERGKEKILRSNKGFEIIGLLLKDEGRELDADYLNRLGKSLAVDPTDYVSGHVPDGLQLSPKMALKNEEYDTDSELEEFSFGFSDDSSQEIIDDLSVQDIKNAIKDAKKLLENETDPLKITKAKENIARLKKYLSGSLRSSKKPKMFRQQEKERSRTNVQKRIINALKEIERQDPFLAQYLNSGTIKTGTKCVYKQEESKKILWMLDPP